VNIICRMGESLFFLFYLNSFWPASARLPDDEQLLSGDWLADIVCSTDISAECCVNSCCK
jgi:hypothetical protein